MKGEFQVKRISILRVQPFHRLLIARELSCEHHDVERDLITSPHIGGPLPIFIQDITRIQP